MRYTGCIGKDDNSQMQALPIDSPWLILCSTRQCRPLRRRQSVCRKAQFPPFRLHAIRRTPSLIDGSPQLSVVLQIVHQDVHSFDAFVQIDQLVFFWLFVQSLDGVINCFPQDCRQTLSHRLMRKTELVVSSVGRPRWVVGIDTRGVSGYGLSDE
jgi:hypothetical protein